ncbi:MAG: oxygen-insensitive nitroreductase [Pseudomonadota bacterium]|jgi:nitroreductase
MTDTPVMQQQRAHRSVRQYTGEPIAESLLEEIVRAGQAAASSSFIQAYSVVRVTRTEARRAIAAAAGGQAWIEQAAEFLVFCADLRRLDAACRHAGAGPLEGYAEHSLAAVVDVALLAQNVLLAAESAGLGGVYIGGIRNAPQVVVAQLALPDLVLPVFGMCLGWPAAAPEVKPRLPLQLILHQDRYRDPDEAQLAAYDAEMAEYYRTRSSNTKLSDWRSAAANALQGKKREHMLDFLRQRGFFRR